MPRRRRTRSGNKTRWYPLKLDPQVEDLARQVNVNPNLLQYVADKPYEEYEGDQVVSTADGLEVLWRDGVASVSAGYAMLRKAFLDARMADVVSINQPPSNMMVKSLQAELKRIERESEDRRLAVVDLQRQRDNYRERVIGCEKRLARARTRLSQMGMQTTKISELFN